MTIDDYLMIIDDYLIIIKKDCNKLISVVV